jgi:hypothetical protein
MNFLHDAEVGSMPLPPAGDSLSSSSVSSPRRLAHHRGADIPPTDAAVAVAATESSSSFAAAAAAAAVAAPVDFSFRKVSLDRPVAPLLAQPMAPFVKKSNRKKAAFMSASFYSECFLNGIGPVDADTAAMDAQSRYDKWWKSTRYHAPSAARTSASSQQQLEPEPPGKRQKRLLDDHCGQQHQDENAQSDPSYGGVVMGQTTLIPSSSTHSSSPSSSLVSGGTSMPIHRIWSRQDSVVSSSEGEQDSKQRQQKENNSIMQPPVLLLQQQNHHHKRPLVLLDFDFDAIDNHHDGCCSRRFEQNEINRAKADMIQDLKISGGDTTTDNSTKFLACLNFLQAFYTAQGCDARWTSQDASCLSDGAWLNLTKPTFADCLGQNEQGQYIYTLGRLAFDMFRPTNLRCILRGVFNAVGLPSSDGDDDERPRSFPSGMYMPSSRTCLQQQQSGRPIVRNNE